ncbi:MAG: hypothetical protein HYT97_09925 [Elusimicrobia bacterium]|nr:hypothetical protein [Elusimicrobiota bacterium]
MNKKIYLTFMGLIGLLTANNLISAEKHGDHLQGKTGYQNIQGEILDMACYMAHEGKGAKHKKCAEQCIKGGAPLGLLTKESQVYLLVEDHNAPNPYNQIKTWAAEQVMVKGQVEARGGVQAIIVKSSEKVK